MKQLLCVLLCLPSWVFARTDSGIKFIHDLSWQQVLTKAQAENKYIFVGCYTTWCGHCKEMDKEVYPQEKVGAAFNDRFISVEVQMDITPNDSEQVKNWYVDAKNLQETYKLQGFPSF